MSLCFLTFHLTISVLKSTTTQHPKLSISSTSCASHASQVWCADLITTQVDSFFFLCFGLSRPRPIVGSFKVWLFVSPSPLSAPFEVWLIVSLGPSSAPFEVRLIVSLGPSSAPFKVWLIVSPSPLLAHFGVWPVVGPFESTFTSHLPLSLAARQPLSSSAASTIYRPFPASVTAVIIVSDFKLKVAKYSTLSLRGDVRIFYIILVYYVALYVLGFSFGFLAYHSSLLCCLICYRV
jgi:hypothetical protein